MGWVEAWCGVALWWGEVGEAPAGRAARSMVQKRRERRVRWQPVWRSWSNLRACSSTVKGVRKPSEPIEKEITGGIA